jgi:hypothetical protein
MTKREYLKCHQQIHDMNFYTRVSRNTLNWARHFQNAVGHYKTFYITSTVFMNTRSRFVFSDIKHDALYSDTSSDNSRHSTKSFRVTATQRSPLIHFAVSSNPRVLIQCVALNVEVLTRHV